MVRTAELASTASRVVGYQDIFALPLPLANSRKPSTSSSQPGQDSLIIVLISLFTRNSADFREIFSKEGKKILSNRIHRCCLKLASFFFFFFLKRRLAFDFLADFPSFFVRVCVRLFMFCLSVCWRVYSVCLFF